jgi:uncharacterized protein YndB with AHSA1/START domain
MDNLRAMTDFVLPITRSLSVEVEAPPSRLWPLISDPAIPARFSHELQTAHFVAGDGVAVGSVIEGHNARGGHEWTTHSTVTACEENQIFRWAVDGPDKPVATWSFVIAPTASGSILTETVTLHEDREPLAGAIAREPERAEEIVTKRVASLLDSMRDTIDGIAALAEGREVPVP